MWLQNKAWLLAPLLRQLLANLNNLKNKRLQNNKKKSLNPGMQEITPETLQKARLLHLRE